MKPTQKTNHFPGSENLGRKDLLTRQLARMQRSFGPEYGVAPASFVLPKDAKAWQAACLKRPGALWIWKPCNGRCGRRITILDPSGSVDDESRVEELCHKRGVVQSYISNPLLIDGYKFDLRIYVVVMSFDPLKIYLNTEGLVRLATEKYKADADTLGTRTMHLTNYSINKYSPTFVPNRDGKAGGESSPGGAGHPSKWSFKELRTYFEQHHLDYDGLFDRIVDLIIKTLIAVEPSIRQACTVCVDGETEGEHLGSRAFEIYGFDVLVDNALLPWLLEVNIYPSLRTDSPLDKRIKTELVADTLTLIGLQPDDRGLSAVAASASMRGGDAEYAKKLAAMSPRAAVAAFNEAAWDVVLDACDEELRSGGLQRIFPAADSGRYSRYFEKETFGNVVLQKWHESGGSTDLLQGRRPERPAAGHRLPPPPRWENEQVV